MQTRLYVRCGGVFGSVAGPLAKLRLILASVLQTTPMIFESEWDPAAARGPHFERLLADKSGWTKNTPTGSASPRTGRALDFCPGQLDYIPLWLYVHFRGVFELLVSPSPLASNWSPSPLPP